MVDSVWSVFTNLFFWAGIWSWCAAQFTKMLCGFYRTHRLDFTYLVSTGGMPSAHSASVSGLATSVGIIQGFGSAIFAIALCLAIIVMFDASTVRRAAGLQAMLLNEMVDELFKDHHFSQRKLKELLGHTRLEVFMGMVMGILVGMLVSSYGI
jgi:acid phosphatase family membrane protein YuiD